MKQLKIYAPIFIIFAAFLWALDGIVLRPALYTLPVPLVVFVEHGLAFLLMLPFFIKEFKEIRKLKTADWGAFLWVAVFGGALGTMFITKALFYVQFVNLSIVVLIQKLQPVFALTLGAAFAWGSSTVFSKRALKEVNFRIGTYLRFGLTTLIMFFIAASAGSLSAVSEITSRQFSIFWIIVFSSGGVAMFLYYYGLKRVTASVSTICELAFPLSAIFLEFLVHGRLLTWSQWLGAIVLFVAIYQVSLIQKRMD